MAAGDVTKVDRGPGYLVKAPTSATGPSYGGTILGLTRGQDLKFISPATLCPAEELGGAPWDGVEGGEWPVFLVLFREWDDDILQTIYRNTATGGSSGKKVVTGGAAQTVRAGHRLSDRGQKLLFAPHDPTKRAVLLLNALPVLAEDSPIAFAIAKEQVHAVSFIGAPDASGLTHKVGLIGDLGL